MNKQATLACTVALALMLPGAAFAERRIANFLENIEYYGFLKNETSFYTNGGEVTGQAKTTVDNRDKDTGEVLKFENSARLFLNGEFGEQSSWHLDLNLIYDTEGAKDHYKGHRIYSQHDYFREGYVDTVAGPVELRLGKQQVVWGTADGIKLLDIINPTDFREFNQNTFEDSRIPVWIGKAELPVGDGGNMQFIAAQHRTNRIPGLTFSWNDRGHPFIARGVDTITGRVNGFFNIEPALGSVASAFNNLGVASGSAIGLLPFVSTTVDDFATNSPLANPFAGACALFGAGDGTTTSAPCLKTITEAPRDIIGPGTGFGGNNLLITNLIDANTQNKWNISSPNSAFEYLPLATFATFNTFVGSRSVRDKDTPDDHNLNYGFRWKDNIQDVFNYSLNYFYSYDQNPSIDLRWKGTNTGERLEAELAPAAAYAPLGIPVAPGTENRETVVLKDRFNRTYGAFDGDPTLPDGSPNPNFGGPTAGPVTLEFRQRWNRIHNIGGSFDYSFGLEKFFANPLVLRGELLFQKDTRQPVVDRGELAIGNITSGLLTEKQDQFKYVIGLDFLVWTNLTISTQFIQFINLDYENEDSRVRGFKRYTGDAPVLHLDNQLRRAKEFKEFYTLFLSKPFGPSQLGRVNNLLLYEEGGGFWNRFDVEYQFFDELVVSAEYNAYWGDGKDTWFGQFNNSSNFQVGLKYIFE